MCSVTELQFKVPLLHFGGGANDLKEMQSQSEKAFYDRREVMKRILNGRNSCFPRNFCFISLKLVLLIDGISDRYQING